MWPAATPARTRCGWTTLTERRGRSTPCWRTSRWSPASCAPSHRRAARDPARRESIPRLAAEVGRRAFAEFLGTAGLIVAVIGSGIAAARLSPHDTGLELLENAVATGAALVALI